MCCFSIHVPIKVVIEASMTDRLHHASDRINMSNGGETSIYDNIVHFSYTLTCLIKRQKLFKSCMSTCIAELLCNFNLSGEPTKGSFKSLAYMYFIRTIMEIRRWHTYGYSAIKCVAAVMDGML